MTHRRLFTLIFIIAIALLTACGEPATKPDPTSTRTPAPTGTRTPQPDGTRTPQTEGTRTPTPPPGGAK